MGKYNNILVIIFIACILTLFVGCQNNSKENNSTKIDFPLDDDNYPKINIVKINDEYKEFKYAYGDLVNKDETIEYNGELKKDEIKIILPQAIPILTWIVDENISGLELINSTYIVPDKKPYDRRDGQSNSLQVFTFKITDKDKLKNIQFKKVNVNLICNSMGKRKLNIDYNTLDYDYQLNIKFN